MGAFRTILHGQCLLNGKHPPGSPEAKECPVLRRQRRQEAPQEAPGAPPSPSEAPESVDPISIAVLQVNWGFRNGRPRKYQDAAARQRAYRERKAGA